MKKWGINCIGWLLIAWLWSQELFAAEIIQTTFLALGWICGWALLVFLTFYLWTRYRTKNQSESKKNIGGV